MDHILTFNRHTQYAPSNKYSYFQLETCFNIGNIALIEFVPLLIQKEQPTNRLSV